MTGQPARLGTFVGLLSLLLAACAPSDAGVVPGAKGSAGGSEGSDNVSPAQQSNLIPRLSLRDYGPAPELTNAVWRNTPNNSPLRLADLRGKVVAIDFWTFG